MTDGIAPSSSRAAVQHGLDCAPSAATRFGDLPLARFDEAVRVVTSPAVKDALAARVGMIVKGHTLNNDEVLPVGWLPMEAGQMIERARSALSARPCDLIKVRRLLVEAVAFGLAAVDRIDREGVFDGQPDPNQPRAG